MAAETKDIEILEDIEDKLDELIWQEATVEMELALKRENVRRLEKEKRELGQKSSELVRLHCCRSSLQHYDSAREDESGIRQITKTLELKDKLISELKVREFKSEMERIYKCTCCKELIVVATSLQCMHTFCQYCIHRWMEEKSECPLCREAITSARRNSPIESAIEILVGGLSEKERAIRQQLVEKRKELMMAVQDVDGGRFLAINTQGVSD